MALWSRHRENQTRTTTVYWYTDLFTIYFTNWIAHTGGGSFTPPLSICAMWLKYVYVSGNQTERMNLWWWDIIQVTSSFTSTGPLRMSPSAPAEGIKQTVRKYKWFLWYHAYHHQIQTSLTDHSVHKRCDNDLTEYDWWRHLPCWAQGKVLEWRCPAAHTSADWTAREKALRSEVL